MCLAFVGLTRHSAAPSSMVSNTSVRWGSWAAWARFTAISIWLGLARSDPAFDSIPLQLHHSIFYFLCSSKFENWVDIALGGRIIGPKGDPWSRIMRKLGFVATIHLEETIFSCFLTFDSPPFYFLYRLIFSFSMVR